MNAEFAEKWPERHAEEGGKKGWISCCSGYALAVRDPVLLDLSEGIKATHTARNGGGTVGHRQEWQCQFPASRASIASYPSATAWFQPQPPTCLSHAKPRRRFRRQPLAAGLALPGWRWPVWPRWYSRRCSRQTRRAMARTGNLAGRRAACSWPLAGPAPRAA